MALKDVTEKVLEAHADVFADIVNVLLFNGERKVDPKDLIAVDTVSTYKYADSLKSQERDVVKIWKDHELSIGTIGMENQTAPEKGYPLRIISYDGAAYRQQLNEIRKAQEENIKRRKAGKPLIPVPKIRPVITLTLYFGEKEWNQPLSIHESIEVGTELLPFVQDYSINLHKIAFLTDEQVSMFQSDFRIVADFLVRKRRGEKDIQSTSKYAYDKIRHVEEMLNFLSQLTNDTRYREIYSSMSKADKEEASMCTVLDYYIDKGEKQGLEKGLLSLVGYMKKQGRTISSVIDEIRLEPDYDIFSDDDIIAIYENE